MRCSDKQFKQLSDMYLKIRNTARYILGNLNGFDPVADRVAFEDMLPLDRWAMIQLNDLVRRCTDAYEAYDFYVVSHSVHKFCIMEMSNFYLDIIKDRLYCDGINSLSRRSAQTAIYEILSAITRLLAPILAFTTYEIWAEMNHGEGVNPEHVMLNDMPVYDAARVFTAEEAEYWDKVLKLRGDVNKALELARAEKRVGKPLDAKITLYVSEEAKAAFEQIKGENFEQICIVSEVIIVDGEGEGYKGEQFGGITVKVESSEEAKCPRCWMHSATVGSSEEHPALCARCAAALAE
jgi:isoleucyl-tRNA synthetase